MKIIVERNQFLKALKFVSQIIPQNPILPILLCVLIKAIDGNIVLSGTDLDILSEMTLKCKVEENGKMAVNAKRLLDIIQGCKNYEINITVNEETIIINQGESETKIIGISSSDFPELNVNIENDIIDFSNIDLATMIEKTSFSVSQDRTRLALTGILWKITPDKMVMVATDGHKLSFCEKQIDIKIGKPIEIILPIKTINYVLYLLNNGIKLKTISKDDDRILFDFDKIKVISKHIKEDYPNYEQVIPKYNSKKVYVSTKKFSDAVKKMIPTTNTITHLVLLTISSGKMELLAKNEDIGGESRESIDVRYDGEPMTTGYNAVFLSEILHKIETDEVLLEIESPQIALIMKPVFKSSGVFFEMGELDDYLYLIMPLRLDGMN